VFFESASRAYQADFTPRGARSPATAARSEQRVVDGRRCLELENVAGLSYGRVKLERHDLARRVEVALDMRRPVTRPDTRAKAIHPVRYEEPDDGGRIILGEGGATLRLRGARKRARVRSAFRVIGAIIGVPTAAGLPIVAEELTAGRPARIAAADVAERQQPA
jgi:hypothetical protein